jgi:hypothetical protein
MEWEGAETQAVGAGYSECRLQFAAGNHAPLAYYYYGRNRVAVPQERIVNYFTR